MIGIDGRYDLVDGTGVTQPKYASWFEGEEWAIENYGVDPDIEVPLPPNAWVAGEDPQLARGVTEALALLEQKPSAVAPPAARAALRPAQGLSTPAGPGPCGPGPRSHGRGEGGTVGPRRVGAPGLRWTHRWRTRSRGRRHRSLKPPAQEVEMHDDGFTSQSPLPADRPLGVLVGFDDSDHSVLALHYAARAAQRMDVPLTVVTAYTVPTMAYADAALIPASPPRWPASPPPRSSSSRRASTCAATPARWICAPSTATPPVCWCGSPPRRSSPWWARAVGAGSWAGCSARSPPRCPPTPTAPPWWSRSSTRSAPPPVPNASPRSRTTRPSWWAWTSTSPMTRRCGTPRRRP